MKPFVLKIKTVFSKLSSREVSYDKKTIRPGKDWKIIIVTFQVSVIILGVFAFYFYTKINAGELFLVDSSVTDNQIKINETLLRKVSSDLVSRENNFQNVKRPEFIVPTDPSI